MVYTKSMCNELLRLSCPLSPSRPLCGRTGSSAMTLCRLVLDLIGHGVNLKTVNSGNELILWTRRSQLRMYL